MGLEDRPISPFRKAYEIWCTNPTARRISLGLKWLFAIGFLLYWKDGSSLPGQKYLRLLEMQGRFYSATRQGPESSEYISTVVRYLSWKVEFAKRHGLLSAGLLAGDLNFVRRHLFEKRKNIREEHENALVYDVLAYLKKAVIPAIAQDQHL